MSTHPQQHHATANLWAITATWPTLDRWQHGTNLARNDDTDRGTIRAWAPGHERTASGGHPTRPIEDAIARDSGRLYDPTTRVATRATSTLRWLARDLGAEATGPIPDVLHSLRSLVPTLTPTVADRLARWTADEDHRIRQHLQLGDDLADIPGARCPACSARRLATRTSAPEPARVIVCAIRCECRGPGCPCGMTIPTAGVAHVWTPAELALGPERIAA